MDVASVKNLLEKRDYSRLTCMSPLNKLFQAHSLPFCRHLVNSDFAAIRR